MNSLDWFEFVASYAMQVVIVVGIAATLDHRTNSVTVPALNEAEVIARAFAPGRHETSHSQKAHRRVLTDSAPQRREPLLPSRRS